MLRLACDGQAATSSAVKSRWGDVVAVPTW
jgi:hypothetical protein